MTRVEEVEIVKKALDLERDFEKLTDEYNEIEAETFPVMREAPQMSFNKMPYPDVTSDLKFNILWFLLIFLGPIGWIIIIVAYIDFNNNKQRYIERARLSDEYLAKCREVDAINANREAEAQRIHNQEMNIFNRELDEYKKKKAEWLEEKNRRLDSKKSECDNKENEMEKHYKDSCLIPLKYHSVVALEYIYEIVGYSQYTFKEAAQDYEIFLNRKMEAARLTKEDEISATMNQMLIMSDELVGSLNGMTGTISRFSRNEAISNGIAMIQRHNTNRILNRR